LNQKDQQRIDPEKIKKVLLIRLRRIGDVIMTTPAVSVLRKNFPGIEISYVIEKPYADLITGNPQIKEIFMLPAHARIPNFFSVIKKIRKKRFDAVIDFHGGPRSSLMTLLSGADVKIGYKIKYRHPIYHIKLPRRPRTGPIHSVENHVNLVKALGIKSGAIPPLFIPSSTEKENQKIKHIMSLHNLSGSEYISLHIGAGNRFRSWDVQNYIRLCDLFTQKSGVKVVLLGAQEDKKSSSAIIKSTESAPLSLVGELSLREARDMISHSSLFVGPDSGPMHIAASTGTPIVALFGPTLPANFGPWRAEHKIIQKDLDCRPCRQRQCVHEDFRCLQGITPEEVYEAGLEYLQRETDS